MLKHKLHNSSIQTLIPFHNPNFLFAQPNYATPSSFPVRHKSSLSNKTKLEILRPVKAVLSSSTEKSTTVTAVITVLQTVGGNLSLSRGLDIISDVFGRALLLELVAADLDPKPKGSPPSKDPRFNTHRSPRKRNFETDF